MGYTIAKAEARLVRVPVDPPRGDAIQQFNALELPIVTITDSANRIGIGFGYTIGTGGSSILELLRAELLDCLIGQDARRITFIHEHLNKSIHALTPGCISSTALAAIDVALWDLAGKRTETPLHILLGGAKDRVLIYNTMIIANGFSCREQIAQTTNRNALHLAEVMQLALVNSESGA